MTWHPDLPLEYRNQIVTGDARELTKRIPDESIDLIFTDPPYLKEYLHLYEWISEEGSRILKQGGWLFCYGAGEHMPARLAGMEDKGLDYFWVFILLHNGGYPRMWNKTLMSGYKPIFVYTKGKPRINKWMSTIHSDAMDKRFHHWGQGAGMAIKIIEMLTDCDDVILDPFVGGGTTASVCKILDRNYIAFEIDPDTAKLARERVRNTQPPLFVLEPEQLDFKEDIP